MEFIKFVGATAKTAAFPKENILSVDLISSTSMRIRVKSTVAKVLATATCTIGGGGGVTSRVIQAATVVEGGGIYNGAPKASLSYGNGDLTPVLTNGIMTSLTITAAGNTYTDAAGAPVITITSPTFSNDSYDEIRVDIKDGTASRILDAITSDGNVEIKAKGMQGAIVEIGVFLKGIMTVGPNNI